MRNRHYGYNRLATSLLPLLAAVLTSSASAVFANDENAAPRFSASDLRGTWTMTGWVEATLLIPFPGEITHGVGPGDPVSPGDKVSVRAAMVGLLEFNGTGAILQFNDVFKPGGIEPMSPPFPIPWVPPLPEQGYGSYRVEANGMVSLFTEIIDPASGNVAGEADYSCVLNRAPKRLDCVFARFRTYVVDPAGYDAPITGQVTMVPQR